MFSYISRCIIKLYRLTTNKILYRRPERIKYEMYTDYTKKLLL